MLDTEGLVARATVEAKQSELQRLHSAAKAFALVGYQSQGLLTLEQLQRLFHREGSEAEQLVGGGRLGQLLVDITGRHEDRLCPGV